MHPGADVDVVSLAHSFGPISPEERDELQVMIYVLLVAAGVCKPCRDTGTICLTVFSRC